MKKINIAFQVGSSEELEGVLAYCAEHGIRAYSFRAMLAAMCRFMGRVAMRLTDIVVSLSLLLTLFPLLYVVVAIVVKRRSPGPAIVLEPAQLASGRRCVLFTFRMQEEGGRPLIALAPRLINILLGQLSLFGKAPVLLPVSLEAQPDEDEAETIHRWSAADASLEPEVSDDDKKDSERIDVISERVDIISNTETEQENNVISEQTLRP